ncbi:glycosyltransferase [Longimicrobium sp.]|uniref:glycosyltransferase family 2 protein n=1 Tax=Longimicrobium sp. TaxID=2029185 RepID=UPI002E32B3A3|nr:glycosyltransferase [Longimicrobium sp.]HEX6038681.1 glycosyltransferase [Longimicrobium sp.]
MNRVVTLGGGAAALAVFIVFHHLWRGPPPPTFASAFFYFCGVLAAVSITVSRRGNDWSHLPPARGRTVVVIPAFNEPDEMLHRTIASLLAGSVVPDVLYVVDDGSARPIAPFDHPKVVWRRQGNTGKRRAQVAALAGEIASRTADFLVTVDSDCVLERDCLRECLRPLSDPRVQAATATPTVLNRTENLLTRLIDLEIVTSCLVTRGLRSRVGAVSPTSGAMSVYRAGLLFENVDDYVASGTIGDDRRLSHYALLRGKVVAVESAMVETLAPASLRGLYLQRDRWYRGYFRYLTWELRHLHGMALAFRCWNFLLVVLYPVIMGWAFLVVPLAGGQVYAEALVYWLALMYCQTVRYVAYDRPGMPLGERVVTWLAGTPLLILYNLVVLRVAIYRAVTRAGRTHWQTRGDPVPGVLVGGEA